MPKQTIGRATCSDIDDAKAWKATQRLNQALMERECYVDGRSYGSGSGSNSDYRAPQSHYNSRPAMRGRTDYSGNKFSQKKYG